MTAAREVTTSSYMHWAKTSSTAKFNLATSGMPNLSIRDLRVSLDDLEITDGGYGYGPLIERIGERYRVEPEFDCDGRRDDVCESSGDGGVDQTGR